MVFLDAFGPVYFCTDKVADDAPVVWDGPFCVEVGEGRGRGGNSECCRR